MIILDKELFKLSKLFTDWTKDNIDGYLSFLSDFKRADFDRLSHYFLSFPLPLHHRGLVETWGYVFVC